MIIDAHVHLFPSISGYTCGGALSSSSDGIIYFGTGKSIRLLPPFFRNNESYPGLLLNYMDWQEVDHAVLMQSQFFGEWNEYMKDIELKYPARFTAVGTYDPYVRNAKLKLEHMVFDNNFKIIKLECSTRYGLGRVHKNLDYADDKFQVLWRLSDRLGLTIVIDTGSMGTQNHQLYKLGDLASKYKNAKLVIAHLGFPPENDEDSKKEEWAKQLEIGKLDNVWFDIANILGLSNEEYPFVLAQYYIEVAYKMIGPKKIIFGSDYPSVLTKCTYAQSIRYIQNNCDFLNNTDKQLVMAENAKNVYDIQS